jgi:hypothetical protein
MRAPSLLLTLTLLASADTFAQSTPWGDPDLQGVWSNLTPVPLERPAALADKPFFTPAEAVEVEKNALATVLKNVASQIATSGEFNEIWLESAKGRVPRNLSTSLVIDPPDGKIPYTREGRARWEETPHLTTERITGRTLRADTWEDRALQERCITSDTMFYANGFYNNYMQIVQAPGFVAIRVENMHETRVIPLDGRPRLGANIKQWTGDARGWWDGKTLVVETTNFNSRRRFHGATENLKLVVRFTRVDNDTIDYRLTVSDPETFTQPWTLANSLWRTDDLIYEAGCHEGNIGLAAILAGARAQEKRAQEKK